METTWRSVRVSSPLDVAASLGLANRPLTFRATLHVKHTLSGSRSPVAVCQRPALFQVCGVACSVVSQCYRFESVRLSLKVATLRYGTGCWCRANACGFGDRRSTVKLSPCVAGLSRLSVHVE